MPRRSSLPKLTRKRRPPLVPIDGYRVQVAIDHRGLTPAEVARRAGVLAQTLDFIRWGRNKRARQDVRAALARALGASVPWLAGDESAKAPAFVDQHLSYMQTIREAGTGEHDASPAHRLALRSEIETSKWAQELAPLAERDGRRVSLVRRVLRLWDVTMWGGMVSADRPGTAAKAYSITTDEADSIIVPLVQAARAFASPWLTGKRGVSSYAAAALERLANLVFATADSLKHGPDADPAAWVLRQAVANDAALLYRRVCGVSLSVDRAKALQQRIREAEASITELPPEQPAPSP